MANRNRPVQIIVRLTPEERALLSKRMELFGTNNMSAYIRKMILDGYMIRLDFPELCDYVSLQRRASNNFNQIARRVNSTGRIYDTDIQTMRKDIDDLWGAMNVVLEKLASIN